VTQAAVKKLMEFLELVEQLDGLDERLRVEWFFNINSGRCSEPVKSVKEKAMVAMVASHG
jgi:hypothetical protein